jgi:hypothetical protein
MQTEYGNTPSVQLGAETPGLSDAMNNQLNIETPAICYDIPSMTSGYQFIHLPALVQFVPVEPGTGRTVTIKLKATYTYDLGHTDPNLAGQYVELWYGLINDVNSDLYNNDYSTRDDLFTVFIQLFNVIHVVVES